MDAINVTAKTIDPSTAIITIDPSTAIILRALI
jgi:hypothetical protein